jgi:hypothetical protein
MVSQMAIKIKNKHNKRAAIKGVEQELHLLNPHLPFLDN